MPDLSSVPTEELQKEIHKRCNLLKPGDVIRHFKGKTYVFLGLAKHTETGEKLALYRNDSDVFARPWKMFNDTVTVDGKKVKRFKKCGSWLWI